VPVFKCMMFLAQGRAGWTEAWYVLKDNKDLAMTQLVELRATRMQLCGKGTQLDQLRVTEEGSPGNSKRTSFYDDAGVNSLLVDIWQTTCVGRVFNGSRYSRTVYCRSVPDDFVQWSPGFNQVQPRTPAFAAFTAFVKDLVLRQFMFRAYDKEGVAGTGVAISVWGEDADGNTTITAAGLNSKPGELVGIKYTVGGAQTEMPLINRNHTVLKVAGNVYTLSLSAAVAVNKAKYKLGFAFRKQYKFWRVTDGMLLRVSTKKAGEALHTFHGRKTKTR
jgi:hypothetical protein